MKEFFIKISATKEAQVRVYGESEEAAIKSLTSGGEMDLLSMWSEPHIKVDYCREVDEFKS